MCEYFFYRVSFVDYYIAILVQVRAHYKISFLFALLMLNLI
jgi:hypothetical protein